VTQTINRFPDPMAKWTPVPDWALAGIEREDWSARPVATHWAALIGGDISKAIAALAPQAPEIGLFGVADTPRRVLRIARDKALLVAAAPIDMTFGWNVGGWSTTPADSMYRSFDLSGREMRRVLAEATAADLELGGRSAATLFAGVPAILYRSAIDVARLAVEIGYAPYVWRWLETHKG
jgi:sarcosine oxidase gamma subunit